MSRLVLALAAIVVTMTVTCLAGCASKYSQALEQDLDKTSWPYVYTDPGTGVQYLVASNTYGCGICPRYNADGSMAVGK